MTKVKFVIYSLGLNVAVNPNTAKSTHFRLFGEYDFQTEFDIFTRRKGIVRITVGDDVENVETIARVHKLESHYTLSGDSSKIIECVFFSPVWSPKYPGLLSYEGGWDPLNNPLQSSIDFAKENSYELFLSEISKLCNAVVQRSRPFTESEKVRFSSSHAVLIVDDLDAFIEQIDDFRIKGGAEYDDVVRRMEVNFYDYPQGLGIHEIRLGMLPMNCIVLEGKDLFKKLEDGSSTSIVEYTISREILEKIEEVRDKTMTSELYSLLGIETIILEDCYQTLVQAMLDMEDPNISQEDRLEKFIEINNSLDFYQLSLSLMKEWSQTPYSEQYISTIELNKVDQKFSKFEKSLNNRIDLEKMQIDHQRTQAENRKEDWFNKWSLYLAFLVLFEVASTFLSWLFPQGDVWGIIGFSSMIIIVVIMFIFSRRKPF